MKTKLLITSLLSFVFCLLSSQIPQGFNYQAIARDGSGAIIANQSLPVKIAIQTSSTGGTVIWEEQHSYVTSNQFGLISFVVGTGTKLSGTAATFTAIDWNAQTLYLKTTIQYPGMTWTVMGTTQIWSVPYSMVAKDVEGPITKLGITGTTSNMEEALFEVKNKDGQTIFAVYNEGVRIWVDDGNAKGAKGGFAVGGFGMNKAEKQQYLYVSGDSIRAYIGPNDKASKGGFAVGSYNLLKAPAEEYLLVTRDSTRVYVNDTPGKASKGGFAVGGFNTSKGTITPFTSLTPDNYLIGHQSGKSITTGLYNSFLGYETGLANTTGGYNAFFGFQTGYKNINGSSNLFLGYQSGFSNTTGSYNSFVGYKAGYANSTGAMNSFLGSYSGTNNTGGYNNTFIGFYSGYLNTGGYENNFIGYRAGYSNSSGHHNIFMGTDAGYSNTVGNYNSFIGFESGKNNSTGSSNVFIGNQVGERNVTTSNNVFVGYLAGQKHTSGDNNIYIGSLAGAGGTLTDDSGKENVFIGYSSGRNNTTGKYNTFLGIRAGEANTTGESNVFISVLSGYKNTSGTSNVLVGDQAGINNTTGNQNVILGREAGINNLSGNQNVMIGYQAGYSNQIGNRNVMIGFQAGTGETGSDRLHIGEGSLIYGEMDNKVLQFNGLVKVNGNLQFTTGANRHIIFPDVLNTLYIGGQPGVTHAPYALSFVTEGQSSIGNIGLIIIGSSQKVGIGTTSPSYKLDVSGDRIRLINGSEWIAMRTDGGEGFLDLSYSGGKLVIQGSAADENIILNPSMNKVGIRTWTPQYDLDVNGNIRAIGSVYYGGTTASANGTAYTKPDYVFEETYKRLSIEEVNEYLLKESHLPWITSAVKEKEENGDVVVDMTRMAFETVETIENLQLQIIEMNKQIQTLREELMNQQKEIKILKGRNK